MKIFGSAFPRLAILLVAVVLLCPARCRSAVDPVSQWHFSHPKPTGNQLVAVTFGNGLFVAAGFNGTIVTSTNGTDWVQQQTLVTVPLRAVRYANGRFVAVGDASTIIVSTDGTNWVRATTGTLPFFFRGVTWGQGLWIAVDSSGYIVTSNNSLNWNVQTYRGSLFSDVTYGDGKFIIVDGSTGYVSSDSTNWFLSFYPNGSRIAFGHGLYVSAAQSNPVSTSTNAFSWSAHSTGFGPPWIVGQITFDGTRFWMVSRDVLNSVDGTNWVRVLTGFPTLAAAVGNGTIVLVGDHGLIFSSADGSNWINRSSITSDNVTSLNYGNSRFVGTLSPGNFIISSNGSAWDLLSSGGTNEIRKLICAGDPSAATNVYLGAAAAGMVVMGSDPTNLVARDTGLGVTLNSIAYGGSMGVVAGDSGKMGRSTDLSSWSIISSGTTNRLAALAYGGGTFVCVGQRGTILSSTDGVTFTLRSSPTTADLVDVAYGMSRFIAVEGNFVDVSTNGSSWQRISVSSSPFTGIGYGAGRFALGSLTGTMRFSLDGGLTWVRPPVSVNAVPMRSVAFGDGSFVAGGDGGVIIQSDPVVQMQIARSSDVILTVSGPRNREYRIEWTDHFPNPTWNLLTTNTPSAESFTVHDPAATNPRFYRAGVIGSTP